MLSNERVVRDKEGLLHPKTPFTHVAQTLQQLEKMGCKTTGCSTLENKSCFRHNCGKPGAGG